MSPKIKLGALALFGALLLTGCGATNKIDGKAELTTPEGHKCYFLKVEREDSSGEEVAESYMCTTKDVFDKNEVGEVYVP